MKSIWKGSIGFGLVNIPVKLYSATQQSNLDMDMIDKRDMGKIHFQRINENTGRISSTKKKSVPSTTRTLTMLSLKNPVQKHMHYFAKR